MESTSLSNLYLGTLDVVVKKKRLFSLIFLLGLSLTLEAQTPTISHSVRFTRAGLIAQQAIPLEIAIEPQDKIEGIASSDSACKTLRDPLRPKWVYLKCLSATLVTLTLGIRRGDVLYALTLPPLDIKSPQFLVPGDNPAEEDPVPDPNAPSPAAVLGRQIWTNSTSWRCFSCHSVTSIPDQNWNQTLLLNAFTNTPNMQKFLTGGAEPLTQTQRAQLAAYLNERDKNYGN